MFSRLSWFNWWVSFGPRRLFCFGSLEILDVVCNHVLLSLLDIKIEKKVKIDVQCLASR